MRKPQYIWAIVLLITLSLILMVNGQNVAAQNTQTVKKELPAVKTEEPPTIDGILNDTCWQDAPNYQFISITKSWTVGRVGEIPRVSS